MPDCNSTVKEAGMQWLNARSSRSQRKLGSIPKAPRLEVCNEIYGPMYVPGPKFVEGSRACAGSCTMPTSVFMSGLKVS